MKNSKTILVIILLIALLGGAYLLYGRLGENLAPDQLAAAETSSSDGTEATEAVSAPDFTVYDRDGNEVHLSDFLGKPIVLNFWASWCGPCQSEMPAFQKAYETLQDDVQFLMINSTDGSRETVESAAAFAMNNGYTFPVYFDTTAQAIITYEAYGLPTTYFIDAEGFVIAGAQGAIDEETLQRGIDMILPA